MKEEGGGKIMRMNALVLICEKHYQELQNNPIGRRVVILPINSNAPRVQCSVSTCNNLARYSARLWIIMSRWEVSFSLPLVQVES
jgi:hypothetical protein